MSPPLRPARALLHPAWLGALAVLALNDHVLKQAGVLPGALTGKLSDVVGLVVAPALIAALAGMRTRRGLLLAHAAAGLFLAAINAWPAAARAVEAASAWTPFPWAVTVDPTDLLALPALLLSWRVLGPAMARPWQPPRHLARLAAAAGGLACMATSPPPEPPPIGGGFPSEVGSLALANARSQAVVLRVRGLADDAWLDCDAVAADPTRLVSRALFAPPALWRLEPGRALVLPAAGAACDAWLVDGDGVALHLVFADLDALPPRALSTGLEDLDPARALRLDGSEDGLAPHPALHAPPPALPAPAGPGCTAAGDDATFAWSAPPPAGSWVVDGAAASPDGCHALDLRTDAGWTTRWYLCLGGLALPLEAGERVDVGAFELGDGFLPVDGVTLATARWRLTAARGGDLVPLGPASGSVRPQAACGAVTLPCGGVSRPLEVRLDGLDAPLRPGEAAATPAGEVRLGRAFDLPAGRDACLPDGARSERWLESARLQPLAPSNPSSLED